MGLVTSVHVDEEATVEVDDDVIVDYVCGNPELTERIMGMDDYNVSADQWANHFWESDAVAQEHMLQALRRVCPNITITFAK